MEHIIKTFYQATPEDIKEGVSWYRNAREWATWCASEYHISPETVVKMIAVLSPRNRWEWNLQDVIRILNAVRDNKADQYIPCHAFQKNVKIAINIARGIDCTHGIKVTAFIDNICHANSRRVTVDVWAFRTWIDDYNAPARQIPPKLYAIIEKDYRDAADALGYKPYEFQAIVWVVARKHGAQFHEVVPNTTELS